MSGVAVAGCSRPYPGETECGDAWASWERESGMRIAVIDGLGHGPAAAHAARRAVESLGRDVALSVTEALTRCHQELMGTRGAAVTVVDADVARDVLTFVGVGNVEGRVWDVGRPEVAERPMVYRGVVGGSTAPRVRGFEVQLKGDWRVLLHTDGVSARLDLTELSRDLPMDGFVAEVVQRWGRDTDDATAVLVARKLPSVAVR